MISNFFKWPSAKPSRYGIIYAVLCGVLPVVPLFNDKAIVPLGIIAALALLVIAYKDNALRIIGRFDKILWVFLGAYLGAAVLSSILGDTWAEGQISLGKLFGLVVLAVLLISYRTKLSEQDIRWLAYMLVAGILMSMSWVFTSVFYETLMHFQDAVYLDKISRYGYFWYKPASTVMAITSLIAGIYLQRLGKPLFAIILVMFTSIICYWIGSRTAGYGMFTALFAGLVYQSLGRYRLKITLVALAFTFFLPVWIIAFDFKPEQISARLDPKSSTANSIVYRINIWRFVADKIAEQPVLGWGAGSSRRLGTDAIGVLTDPTFGELGEPIPIHPHNAILQVWLEFGIVGAIFIYGLIARGLMIADNIIREPRQRIWVFASGMMIANFFGFNFSIASSWWLVTVILCITIAAVFACPSSHAATEKTAESGATP